MDNFIIKKVTPDDWQKFRDIRLAARQEAPQSFGADSEDESQRSEEEWRKRFERADRLHLAAEVDGVFVSTAGMLQDADGRSMLGAVYTLPAFRGKGIMTEIIRRLLDEAKTRGAAAVSLEVNADEESVVGLYRKLGFEVVRGDEGEAKSEMMADGRVHEVLVMKKRI